MKLFTNYIYKNYIYCLHTIRNWSVSIVKSGNYINQMSKNEIIYQLYLQKLYILPTYNKKLIYINRKDKRAVRKLHYIKFLQFEI